MELFFPLPISLSLSLSLYHSLSFSLSRALFEPTCVSKYYSYISLPLVSVGKHAVPHLVSNLPGGGQSQPVRALSEETLVSVLSTLHEVLGSSLDAAKILRASQGIERLVLINKDG